MAKEWIDVADTAVKIGLGALITGVFTYLGIRFNKASERQKYFLEHKSRLLEEASNNLEDYFAAWKRFNGRLTAISKQVDVEETMYVEDLDLSKLLPVDKTLVESWAFRERAITLLRLLSADDIANDIVKLRRLESDIRTPLLFDNILPSYNEMIEYRIKIEKSAESLHNSLSVFFHEIHK